MELYTIQESFEMVAKKQKLFSSKSQELIDLVINQIELALATLESDNDSPIPVDQKSVLTELQAKLQVIGSLNHIEELRREQNTNLDKHQILLENMLDPDISKICRDIEFEPRIVNQIIINHLYREGLFDIVDCLVNEAREPEEISLRLQFQEVHQILEGVKSKNLEPALKWIPENRKRLEESGSDLELKIRSLQFVDILQNQTSAHALEYATTYLAPLASCHMNGIEKLMGALLWKGKLNDSPYADLLDLIQWKTLAKEIMRTICDFSGQPFSDPLKVAVTAGFEGLPSLIELANEMAADKQKWQAMEQLPVPLELGQEFQFHSIFVCPISLDQASDENPPMMLTCRHVLCRKTIDKIAGNSGKVKCPYCPEVSTVANCRQLHF